MNKPKSIQRSLTHTIFILFAGFWLAAAAMTALHLRTEQNEILDSQLMESAEFLLPLVERFSQNNPDQENWKLPFDWEAGDEDDLLVFQLRSASGEVLISSAYAPQTSFADANDVTGYRSSSEHRLYTSTKSERGNVLILGEALSERAELFRDSIVIWATGFVLSLPLAFILVSWLVKRALAPLGQLRQEVELRDSGSLEPIKTSGEVQELAAITDSLNGFMSRLGLALEAERAFAANCAHELRTPVAISLANIQRMGHRISDPDLQQQAKKAEIATKRLARIIERLMQLARAEAGIGFSSQPVDIIPALTLLIDERNRETANGSRIRALNMPAELLSPIDIDAFGIVMANILDNALKYSPENSPIDVVVDEEPSITIRNEGPSHTPDQFARMRLRNATGSHQNKNGLGLGLSIVDTILRHSGGELKITSPVPGRDDGVECKIILPTK